MVRQVPPDHIPPHGVYAVGAPQAADDLSAPLRKAFAREAKLPPDLEACMAQLRRLH